MTTPDFDYMKERNDLALYLLKTNPDWHLICRKTNRWYVCEPLNNGNNHRMIRNRMMRAFGIYNDGLKEDLFVCYGDWDVYDGCYCAVFWVQGRQ